MTKLALQFLLLVGCLGACDGAVLLQSGDSVWGNFETMALQDRARSGWFVGSILGPGEEYRVSVFENSILDPPIYEQTLRNHSENDLNGFSILGRSDDGHFLDQQGAVRIDMIVGTMRLEQVLIVTEISGGDYLGTIESFRPIPEPATGSSLMVALMVFAALHRVRLVQK